MDRAILEWTILMILLEEIWTEIRLKVASKVWNFTRECHEIIISKLSFEERHT